MKLITLTHEGKTQSIYKWAEELGMSVQTLYTRHSRGYSDSETILGKPRKGVNVRGPRKNSTMFMYEGKLLSLYQIAPLCGVAYDTIYTRHYRGCRNLSQLIRKPKK